MNRRNALGVLVVAGASFASASCNPKDALYFAPPESDAASLPDITAPVIDAFLPARDLMGPLNVDGLSFVVGDPFGTNGAPPSGVDASSVGVTYGGSSLALSSNGNAWSGTFGSLEDGPWDFSVSASDFAGNTTTEAWSLQLKRSDPFIGFDLTPGVTLQVSADYIDLSASGTVSDPYLATAVGGFFRVGPDGLCGTPDDVQWTEGTGGGEVFPAVFDYLAGGLGGAFDFTGRMYNPVSEGEEDQVFEVCVAGVVTDFALGLSGQPNPNVGRAGVVSTLTFGRDDTTGSIAGTVTRDGAPWAGATVTAGSNTTTTAADGSYGFSGLTPGSYTVSVTNLPANVVCDPASNSVSVVAGQATQASFVCTTTFQIQVTGSYRHLGSFSRICADITTVPAQPGAAFTLTWAGPGVTGATTVNGNFEPDGKAAASVNIDSYGSYPVSVVSGSSSGGTTISVTGADGTCTY